MKIRLFMKNHKIIEVSNDTELSKINPEDVKFYNVPLSGTSYNEPISIMLNNISLLFEFESAYVNMLCGVCQAPFIGMSTDLLIYHMPRMIKEFNGFYGFIEFISYIFSLKRMLMVNNGIYDASDFDTSYGEFFYMLSDIEVSVKYKYSDEEIKYIKHTYIDTDHTDHITDTIGLIEEDVAGLQYAEMILSNFIGVTNTQKLKKRATEISNKSSLISVYNSSGNMIGIRPYGLHAVDYKYLTVNDTSWKYKNYSDIDNNEEYFIDLYVSDACIVMKKKAVINLEKGVEYLTYSVMGYIDSTAINLDIDQSYGSFSAYAFEKLVLVKSSLAYTKVMLNLVSGKKDPEVFADINIDFHGGDRIELRVTEDSTNVIQTIIKMAKKLGKD